MNNNISVIKLSELSSLKCKDDYIFVNFAYDDAIKISFFYDEISKNELKQLVTLFSQLTGIEIRLDDVLGKLHIILLKLLIDSEKDSIVISNIGFHMISFEFLINNLKKIFKNLHRIVNKNIIIVECNLNNVEDIKYLEQYFESN